MMPVFRSDRESAPAWCEMEYFEIVELPAGSTHTFRRIGRTEKLIVCAGRCCIASGEQTTVAEAGANLDLTASDQHFNVVEVHSDVILVRMCGHWSEPTGRSGRFSARTSEDIPERGDPSDYPKTTSFDNHFHDCDEYWIIYRGRGIAVSEGKQYEVRSGDCVATGMHFHHDFAQVFEPVEAVFFETTLEGAKRLGHLWEHTHGPAQPKRDRM